MVSFGYGVGDIIAVGNLALKICKSLCQSTGSSAEYQALVAQLGSIDGSLREVVGLIRDSKIPVSVCERVYRDALLCLQLLQKFDESITKYKKSLSKGGSKKMLVDSWRKIGWSLFKPEEIKQLRDGLTIHIGAIQLMLAAYTSQTVARVDERMNEIHATMVKFQKFQISIPKDIGYSWAPDYKPIEFTDALEKRFLLPYEICSTQEGIQLMLNQIFKGSAGSDWIRAGQYEIMDEHNQGVIMKLENWKDLIRPGMNLSMSIILKRPVSSEQEGHKCPACQSPYHGYAKSEELLRVRCMKCGVHFQISSMERIEEIMDGNEVQLGGSGETTISSGNGNSNLDQDIAAKFFRRLHILLNEPIPEKEFDYSLRQRMARMILMANEIDEARLNYGPVN